MNDALKMQISAYVDGELPENESDMLLRRLSQDVALRQQAAQYLEIGRVMRNEREPACMRELRGNIATALGEDTIESAEGSSDMGSGTMKAVAGVAIAASVAVLALFGLRQLNLPEAPDLTAGVAIDEDAGTGVTEPAVDDLMDHRLLEMHRRHADLSADFGANGTLTQLVTWELRDGELVEIDPDGHLAPDDARAAEDEAAEDEDLSETQPVN